MAKDCYTISCLGMLLANWWKSLIVLRGYLCVGGILKWSNGSTSEQNARIIIPLDGLLNVMEVRYCKRGMLRKRSEPELALLWQQFWL